MSVPIKRALDQLSSAAGLASRPRVGSVKMSSPNSVVQPWAHSNGTATTVTTTRIAFVGDVHDLWTREDEAAVDHLGVGASCCTLNTRHKRLNRERSLWYANWLLDITASPRDVHQFQLSLCIWGTVAVATCSHRILQSLQAVHSVPNHAN
jgi:hypothetical protein